jgi:hypothetical protein
MTSPAEEIRRQLEESARVKQSFSSELIGRIAQFAEKSAAALGASGKIVFFWERRERCGCSASRRRTGCPAANGTAGPGGAGAHDKSFGADGSR